MTQQHERAFAFQKLHDAPGAFIIPNPWDAGSARVLEDLGFRALATTSSGFAFTLGRLDGRVSAEETLAHCTLLSAATQIPLSADLEHGFSDQPAGVAEIIRRVAETGAVGASIEDYSREAIYDFNQAVERVAAAADAARALPFPFTLTARAENLIRGSTDLGDTIRRLEAFEAAGANVLYAPGLRTLEQVQQVSAALTQPLNVLGSFFPRTTVAELAEAGAKRISVGGALAFAAAGAAIDAGKELFENGSFEWLSRVAPGSRIQELVGDR